MNPRTRNSIGIITSLLWLGVGAYMIFRGVSDTWRMVGFLVVAVGVLRAGLLLRQWNKRPEA